PPAILPFPTRRSSDLPLRIVRAWDDLPIGINYVVLKTGDVGPPWTEGKSRRATARLEDDADFRRAFPVIAEVLLPDGSRATARADRKSTRLNSSHDQS